MTHSLTLIAPATCGPFGPERSEPVHLHLSYCNSWYLADTTTKSSSSALPAVKKTNAAKQASSMSPDFIKVLFGES